MANQRRIYLASSWRNEQQPEVLEALRLEGHAVYDFRHPEPGNDGFHWSEISMRWRNWSPDDFAATLKTHPVAAEGFSYDKGALDWCDTCVLLLPSGRSAHLEAGYAAGQGKQVFVLLHEKGFEPELMYLLCTDVVTSIEGLIASLRAAIITDGGGCSPMTTILRQTGRDHHRTARGSAAQRETPQRLLPPEPLPSDRTGQPSRQTGKLPPATMLPPGRDRAPQSGTAPAPLPEPCAEGTCVVRAWIEQIRSRRWRFPIDSRMPRPCQRCGNPERRGQSRIGRAVLSVRHSGPRLLSRICRGPWRWLLGTDR